MFAELFLKYFSIIFHGMKKPGVVCVGLVITAACLYPALCAPDSAGLELCGTVETNNTLLCVLVYGSPFADRAISCRFTRLFFRGAWCFNPFFYEVLVML